ncbi:ParB/RepB/Spo0J family partition protein [Dietzia sp. CQ4]|uniref:ParB/RepB/Spo0J family partition protein n=1 Tax=Dietzia sp. (strain CQ4) TaxID=370437 RepID=UPI0015F9D04B|nr:ParB/RepB/Spo0J family partition protein [Dietzia sp. CQ4]MBB1034622.1 ParB/RepB/Spo0J family partition protein [Dietzia sp. CQ4]
MTTLQITDLPIHDVYPHPQNVRRELRGIDELADSIKAEGLHQPIIVAPDGDEFVVVLGNSRHAACAQLGWETIPCIVRDDLDTEEKVLSAMLAENCARNDLTITEEGDAFQRLLDLDLSPATVGKRAGRSRKQVSDRVTIASQPEKVRQAVDDRQISLANALTLAELEDDHELYSRVEQSIGTPRFDYEVKRALALRANLKAEHDKRTELTTSGYVEATEKELSALDKPVGGFRLNRLWRAEPEEPDETLRFTIFNPQPEYQGPIVRWYRLVPVEPESTEATAETDTQTPLTSEQRAEREAAEARIAAAQVEEQERKTAADRRRVYLLKLWEEDFTGLGLERTTSLLRTAVASAAYMEPLFELAPILEPSSSQMDEDDPRLDPSDWSLKRLQFATWWCRGGCVGEVELSNLHPNMWDEDTNTYLETLRDLLDYELSDIEEALLDTYHSLTDGNGDD